MTSRILGNRYLIQDTIGTGGMATVYRGLDQVLGRTVAIKTMLPQYAADPSFAARFKQEAQAAAALQSPYIVSVYDWGKDGDTYFIVMEFLRGTDLKSGIRKHGALDCKKVAQIGSQIAQALSVAHRHDIIHRDVKPQNIMVQPDGNIKVMDFGIARAKNSHLTTDNSVLGTAHYVSPEQTQGKDLGPTTDIYSLGIVMYEAATGRVPFDGNDAISVALKQVNEQPKPPSQLNPAVDPSLEGIILKCMQKDPKDRFQTADQLVRVLHDYLAGRLQEVRASTALLSASPTAPISAIGSTKAMPQVANLSAMNTRTRQKRATELAQEQQQEEERTHRRNVFIGTALGIAALILLIVGIFYILNMGSGTKKVPNLIGLSKQEAVRQIEDTKWFRVAEVQNQYNDSAKKGTVFDQDPAAGKSFSKGTEITIYVSKGEEPASDEVVPDLSNLTPTQAEAELAKHNLVSKAGDGVYSDKVEKGKIAEQDPAPNTKVKAGDTVTYQVSLGEEEVEIPNVEGKSLSRAKSALEEAGFKVAVNEQESASVAEGVVISQSQSGTAAKNSTITLTVSSGAAKQSVPNVVGYDAQEAKSQLQNRGFSVIIKDEHGAAASAGVVTHQSPSAGSQANNGATITLTVSAQEEETPQEDNET